MVPEWVTRDIVQAFGAEAKAELVGDGMVRVRRGKIVGTGDRTRVSDATSTSSGGSR
jgi:hypothetical protein